ncbi:DNA repair protein rad2 [Verticillium dahliae VDG1]|nr:DNA repair protein rad2 [Verticillium dahliae VDG1]
MPSPTSSICDHCLESNLEFYETSRDCEAAARVLVTLLGNKSPDMDSLVGYLRSFGGSDKESVYDIETSFLCSATLTAMFFLTLPAYLDIEQRYGSGVFFGFVNWLLFIISMSMKTTAAREAKKVKDDEPFSLEAFCWDKQVSDEGATVTIIALSMVPLCVFLLAGLNAAVAHWMKRPKESVPVLGWLFFRIPWRLAYALHFFVFMWASLGSLFKLKSEISKLNDGGEAKSEERWGFGQILALATWLPVFEEAIMVTYKNVRYANQRRMNGHFVGVEKPVEEESVCLVEQTPQSYAKIETPNEVA